MQEILAGIQALESDRAPPFASWRPGDQTLMTSTPGMMA